MGNLAVKVYNGKRIIQRFSEKNLVVQAGKTNITKLLAGAAGERIAKIAIGTSAAPATVDDTEITDAFIKNIAQWSFPDAQTVQFNFDILNAEGNGIVIREFGLLTTTNKLFARKIRTGEIEKTSAIRIVGSWTISIN